MLSYFEPNFIEKFLWESRKSGWSRDYFRETKIRFLAAILKRNIFLCSFCWSMVLARCFLVVDVDDGVAKSEEQSCEMLKRKRL